MNWKFQERMTFTVSLVKKKIKKNSIETKNPNDWHDINRRNFPPKQRKLFFNNQIFCMPKSQLLESSWSNASWNIQRQGNEFSKCASSHIILFSKTIVHQKEFKNEEEHGVVAQRTQNTNYGVNVYIWAILKK